MPKLKKPKKAKQKKNKGLEASKEMTPGEILAQKMNSPMMAGKKKRGR